MANIGGYTDTVGPFWTDNTTGKKLTLDVSGLTADRVVVFEDAAGTFALFNGSGNFSASADGKILGSATKRWGALLLTLSGGSVAWDDGAGNQNTLTYTNATGPAFFDLTTNFTLTFNVQSLTADRTLTAPDAAGTLALVPTINSQSSAYGIVLTDAFKTILHPAADTTARTFTIPANASVAFPVGTEIDIVNETLAGVVTIAITSDTLLFAGAGTTGSRTLAASGWAKLKKITTTKWIITDLGGLT